MNLTTKERHVLERYTGIGIPGPARGAYAPRAGVEVASTRAALEITQSWIPVAAEDAVLLDDAAPKGGYLFRVTIERRRRRDVRRSDKYHQRSWYFVALCGSTPWEAQTLGLRVAVEGALVALDGALTRDKGWQRLDLARGSLPFKSAWCTHTRTPQPSPLRHALDATVRMGVVPGRLPEPQWDDDDGEDGPLAIAADTEAANRIGPPTQGGSDG